MKKNSEYIGVDEKFIPENEKYVNDSILGSREESKQKIKKAVKIGLGVYIGWVVFILVIIVCICIFGFKMFNNFENEQEQMINNAQQKQQQMKNDFAITANQIMSGDSIDSIMKSFMNN